MNQPINTSLPLQFRNFLSLELTFNKPMVVDGVLEDIVYGGVKLSHEETGRSFVLDVVETVTEENKVTATFEQIETDEDLARFKEEVFDAEDCLFDLTADDVISGGISCSFFTDGETDGEITGAKIRVQIGDDVYAIEAKDDL